VLSNALSRRRRYDDLRRSRRGARLAVCLAAALITSTSVSAQKEAFREALIAFHSKLAGDFGDEGTAAAENLERMSSALAKWDETIQNSERDVRSRLQAAASSERARIHMALAQLYVERGRYRDGIREIDTAIQIESSGTLQVLRGAVLEASGRADEARTAFRRAWELDHDDPVSAYLVASRRVAQADTDETTPQTAALLKAVDRRLASVPSDRHISMFPELALIQDRAAVTPVFSPALYADGFTLVAQGRYPEAIASFRNALPRDPLVAGVTRPDRLQSGISKLRNGDAERAIPDLEAAAAAAPRSPEAHRILAAAYSDAGDDRKSLEHLEAAAALARDDERANVALGRALAHAGEISRAEQVLLKTIETLPQSADAHSALADLYEGSNRGRSALHELEAAAALTVPAGKGALYWRLADLQHRHLEYERVIEPLTRRVALNPNDARSHTDLGLAYTRVGRTGAAFVELAVATLIGPDDPEALTAIGQIHFEGGNYAAAETVLQRAVMLRPALVQARYLLGHTLARLGRTNDSAAQLSEYTRLRAAANDDARRVFELDMLRQEAVRHSQAGRRDEAAAAWRQVVDREPGSRDDRIALAEALLGANRPAAAVEQLEAAARLDANPDVYRRLAEVYSTLGRSADSAAARATAERLLKERRR
jgi:tetratricopeptide (TPR) repeat protein